jgi:hypothetical protein
VIRVRESETVSLKTYLFKLIVEKPENATMFSTDPGTIDITVVSHRLNTVRTKLD